MNIEPTVSQQLGTLQLLHAYERAIDQNIIASITDTKGTIVYANAKFCETSKYSAEELIGQNHRIVNSKFHPKEFFTGMWRTIGAGKVWHEEVRNRAKDGTYYWVDTVVVPIKDEAGQITNYLSLRTLITARKEVEEQRQKYLDALEELLVMTSHRVRKPLAMCLDGMSRLEDGPAVLNGGVHEIMSGLRANAMELDAFTKDLTTFIRDMKT